MLEKLFKQTPPEAPLLQLARIASALERLTQLYELELAAKGISTATDEGEGEVLDSDPDHFEALEQEEERIRVNGLAPGGYYHPVSPSGRGWAPLPAAEPQGDLLPAPAQTSLFTPSGSWAFTAGPEGAETSDAPPAK